VEIIAYLALLLWIPISLILFAQLRPSQAAFVGLLGGSMFLPSAFSIDLPALPPLGKEMFAGVGCLLGCLVFARRELGRVRLGRGPEILIAVMALGAVVTILTNRDPFTVGPVLVRATRPGDVLLDMTTILFTWGVPFVAGRALVRNSRDLRGVFTALALAGLVYSILILVELRLSPQLHRWTYGFHQHTFAQHVRWGGYRPMVFMRHGLHVSLFVFMALMATTALARSRVRILGLPSLPASGYLGVILVACKSVGSMVYGLIAVPVAAFLDPRRQVRVAVIVSLVALSYPMLRAMDWLPLESLIGFAERTVGEERSASFAARFKTERSVMDRVRERVAFGWGGYGRPMVRDPQTGETQTTFDGFWIIALGVGGVVRLLTVFLLLLWPVFAASRGLPRIRSPGDRILIGCLCLMVVVNVFDLLPNSTTEGYLTFLSGALAGAVPGIQREQGSRKAGRRPAKPRDPPREEMSGGLARGRAEFPGRKRHDRN
jgi:hypothetical protein